MEPLVEAIPCSLAGSEKSPAQTLKLGY